ncbi:MAG: signal peptidase II [Clostridia bacterium]|nr:signal peptidase II [Clostridia bacterium]
MKIKEFFSKLFKDKKFLSPFIVCCVFAFALILDQLTKGLIIPKLIPNVYDHIKVIPKFISFIYVQNKGAAWGILKDNTIFLIIMSFIGIALILSFYILRLKRTGNRTSILFAVSVGLIIGGAVGNLADRLIFRYVRDFINFDFMNFPVFNFADVALTFGIIILLIYILFFYNKELVEEGQQETKGLNLFKKAGDKKGIDGDDEDADLNKKVNKNGENIAKNSINEEKSIQKSQLSKNNEEIKDNESRQRRDEKLAEEAVIKQAQEEKDDQFFGGGKDE